MILAALNRLYNRLAADGAVPSFGYSVEKISFALKIDVDGRPIEFEDLRQREGRNARARFQAVPRDPSVARTGKKIVAYPLCDTAAYSLGCTQKKDDRLQEKHRAFVELQHAIFGSAKNPSLQSFLSFLENWNPETIFEINGFNDQVLSSNIVFRLDFERAYLHDLEEAVDIWCGHLAGGHSSSAQQSILTGEQVDITQGPHPKIKGAGGQPAGTALISYDDTAYRSFGLTKYQTAALSSRAVFAYTTTLNYLLRDDGSSKNSLLVGNIRLIFWAEAKDDDSAQEAESLFAALNDPPTDAEETSRMFDRLADVAAGRPLAEIDLGLDPDTRLYVLGLAPNAARLSIRFWCVECLETIVARYRWHWQDLALDPPAWRRTAPALWRLVNTTAPVRDGKTKREDVPDHLAGETMRAILTGRAYPRALLSQTVMRFRNDGTIGSDSVNGLKDSVGRLRVALVKAVLQRSARLAAPNQTKAEIPVSLDRQSREPGYLLGRLFAELENAQYTALGRVNASIKDRYFGSASATPASVFPVLVRNAQHHISRIGKGEKSGLAHHIDTEIGRIIDGLNGDFPKHLKIQDQGRFAIGYYHQREAKKSNADDDAAKN